MKLAVLVSLLLAIPCFTGCISPKAVAKTGASLSKYKRVYVLAPDPDPRNVQPRVVSRLKALGLDVHEVKEGADHGGSQGTGFVITTNGHILTCAHVIGKTNTATLWIKGSRFEADVVNMDTNIDLALLKLRSGEMPPALPIVPWNP